MQKIGFVRILFKTRYSVDESTSNLDKSSKEIVFKLIDNNTTIIFYDPENFDFSSSSYTDSNSR